ncbi:hypothetical protein V2S66_15180 [Streptomyces sp. V4-01]|uniref:LapA family protein n=1 Tax=Actinacidiphila polyblastidii TaxID=3110430 RepID=A0ABU7PDY7_9ACTN|nr:hypothetical protein [Streptomyces sp. V4-01]
MLILGLLLLVCTAAFVGLVISDNFGGGAEHDVTVLGHHIATMNGVEIFCAGLALALIFCLSVLMTLAGTAMQRRRGRKLRTARRDADATARERDELAARLDRIHAEHVAADEDDAAAGRGELAADRERDVAATHEGDLVADRDHDHERDMATAESGATVDDGGENGSGTTHRRHARHLFGH